MTAFRASGLSITVTLVAAAAVALAAPGDLDPTFGSGGIVVRSTSPQTDGGFALVLAPDRTITVATWGPKSGEVETYALARLLRDGAPDATFGTAGIVQTGVVGVPHSIERMADGRLVVGGMGFESDSFRFRFLVMRRLADGRPDPTFGRDGVTETSFYDDVYLACCGRSVAVRPDGRVTLTGMSFNDFDIGFSGPTVAQYDDAGVLDPSWAGDGIVRIDAVGENWFAEASVLQPDGRLLVAGSAYPDLLVLRFDEHGVLDPAFGDGGFVRLRVRDRAETSSIALLPDGRFVVGGCTPTCRGDPFGDAVLARFNPDGTLDETFGIGGVAITPLGAGGLGGSLNAIDVAPDGTVVGTGYYEEASRRFRLAIARWTADGRLDEGFANGVKTDVLPPATEHSGAGIRVAPDGDVVVSGGIWSEGSLVGDTLVVRFQGCAEDRAGVPCRLGALGTAAAELVALASLRTSLGHVVDRALAFEAALADAEAGGDPRRVERVRRKLARMLDVFVRRLDKRRDRGVDAAVVDGFHDDVARVRAALAPA